MQLMQPQTNQQSNKCFFYFIYQMKLQLIPYVEQQIQQFLTLCEEKVHQEATRKQLLVILNKRIKQIDTFFQKQWHDYRTQQILRSRKLLTDFLKKHHQLFATDKKPQIKGEITHTKSVMVLEQSKSRSKGKAQGSSKGSKGKIHPEMGKIYDYGNKNAQPSSKNSQKNYNVYNQSLQVSPQYKSKLPPKSPARGQKSKDQRISSADSNQLKPKTKSHKVMPKMSPTVPKMTKEQYIAYLRNKKVKV